MRRMILIPMRAFPPCAALVAAALGSAGPVLATANLISSYVPPGWSYPALPRDTPDATLTSVPLGAGALPGNSTSTYLNAAVLNSTLSGVAFNFYQAIYLDDVLQAIEGPTQLGPAQFAYYLNVPAPSEIYGGRHTLRSLADVYGDVVETNEVDNTWTRQYIWSGLPLTPNVSVTHSYAPYIQSIGSGPYYNCDGFQGTMSGAPYWYVFAVLPEDPSTDFDIGLCTETPENVPQQGFGATVAYSGNVGDTVDFVVMDRNVLGGGTFWTSVYDYSGIANKVVEFDSDRGTVANPGQTGPFALGPRDLVGVHEVFLYAGVPVRIEAKRLDGWADVFLELFNPSSGFAGSANIVPGTGAYATGPYNDAWFDFTPSVTDYYGIVLAKANSGSLTRSIDYDIVVSQIPNITRYQPAGWDGPIVPRTTTDSGDYYAPLAPVLDGNASTTYFNWSVINQGPGTAPNFWTSLLVDDEERAEGFFVGSLGENTNVHWLNQGPFSVRGGLHYARSRADIFDEVPEDLESDNDFTDWFVWSPRDLADQVPLSRFAPPTRLPLGGGPWEACDGFRTTGTPGHFWTAVAMIPTDMSADYDVRLHSASAGSKDGFADWLIWSWDPFPGNPDFCIVNYNVAPAVPYDVSVTNSNGASAAFCVQRADALYYGEVPAGVSRYGPMTVAAHDCLNIHEFYFQGGVPTYISVNNVSGNLDLEAYLFDGSVPFHMKGTYMTFNNAAGPGGDEHLGPVTFPVSGFYAVVVSKSKAFDVNNAGTYELVISTVGNLVDAPQVGAPLPTEFALSSPRPNPSSGRTSVELAVPSVEGKAKVAVYDLAGRRVRSLVEGEVAPGRHLLTWDGRDSEGRAVAAGVYFVKLEAPHVRATKKVTLLR